MSRVPPPSADDEGRLYVAIELTKALAQRSDDSLPGALRKICARRAAEAAGGDADQPGDMDMEDVLPQRESEALTELVKSAGTRLALLAGRGEHLLQHARLMSAAVSVLRLMPSTLSPALAAAVLSTGFLSSLASLLSVLSDHSGNLEIVNARPEGAELIGLALQCCTDVCSAPAKRGQPSCKDAAGPLLLPPLLRLTRRWVAERLAPKPL
ncbi:hypothetical protein FOA52_009146 [Chlamydomonas sp. UWO 241]|nr:hypothetical protein FOA52_009146 [Chlamydomonas sp. UWO 241]